MARTQYNKTRDNQATSVVSFPRYVKLMLSWLVVRAQGNVQA